MEYGTHKKSFTTSFVGSYSVSPKGNEATLKMAYKNNGVKTKNQDVANATFGSREATLKRTN
jgi:hypothetical protein